VKSDIFVIDSYAGFLVDIAKGVKVHCLKKDYSIVTFSELCHKNQMNLTVSWVHVFRYMPEVHVFLDKQHHVLPLNYKEN